METLVRVWNCKTLPVTCVKSFFSTSLSSLRKNSATFFFASENLNLYPRMVNDSTGLEKIQDGELRFAPRAGDPDVSCQLPKGLNLRSKDFPTHFFREEFFI